MKLNRVQITDVFRTKNVLYWAINTPECIAVVTDDKRLNRLITLTDSYESLLRTCWNFVPMYNSSMHQQKEMSAKGTVHAAPNQELNSIDANFGGGKRTVRKPHQKVYFWPSLTEGERAILRDAFFQIGRRTCVKFEEQEYKPWFHADRWNADQPYVLIRKSKKYAGYRNIDAPFHSKKDRCMTHVSVQFSGLLWRHAKTLNDIY
ncbi:hypothetical protein ANCDUO_14099 [Ancylostoma duodenale]|uniref:Peptidase M12A domain-containing protein n=1 Tax=Ancylostoma duodenale TaxID=51022 RepID=A0A0C2CH91_9BILA|nr:hypothetical protein ANCDUO_14099 [Ancylostoma duodenale]